MYYIERIINGILCCKWTPDGAWEELSKEKMTEKILALKAEIETLKAQQEIKEHEAREQGYKDGQNDAHSSFQDEISYRGWS